MDNLQPFPVELSFVLKIKFFNLFLQGVQLISVAAGHHYDFAFYKSKVGNGASRGVNTQILAFPPLNFNLFLFRNILLTLIKR
jgi:hypothetical protein